MGVIKNSDVFGPDLFTKEAKDAKTLNDALNIVEQSLKDIAKLSVKAFKGVNPKTAEDIKIKIGTATHDSQEHKMEIRGRDLISGLPKNITISSNEV
ncbi:MAG: rod shape-determining protein, partial [Chloroflexi bacterium]|nr:rod shape-determining protein [Chloroflexota bacterium]